LAFRISDAVLSCDPGKASGMKKLLIHGWHGINHSYAMVNQHQILALANLGGVEICHHDMPFRHDLGNWGVF
jgi:hypothetical protein